MKLIRYRVENFRSIEDSGWIDCDDVTTLVGINESGKSNLLLALWRLKPARAGKIDVLHDLPVSKLSTLRNEIKNVRFISAEFSFDEETIDFIRENEGVEITPSTTVTISRFFDGHYAYSYSIEPTPNAPDGESSDPTIKLCAERINKAVFSRLPKFVYYSNYGNLSSKIYLPNVIKWLNKETVPGIEVNEDQVRTLRVLFEFVKLKPQEILDLGKDPKVIAMERSHNRSSSPSLSEITRAENDKEQRSILLQSASVDFTKKFKQWWNQGEYKFRFEADGDYFRIWVSDRVRTDEVGLELRSTGLQWFVSFYLIFLVESWENHKNAILLLDEAGLTLHPLAQRDLSHFFDSLSKSNQIINTTHSPFIIDPTNIDRCRVVYMDENGYTVASSDLRQGADALNEKSIYAVHAAMGLSVSDVLMQGCQCIVVEGPSDQHYMNGIKSFLIKEKLVAPKQELVFVPSGGVKGIPGVVSILSSKSDDLPVVLVDSDKSGQDSKKKLISGLYKGQSERIIDIKSIVGFDNTEVEDLVPLKLLKRQINKFFLEVEDEDFFEDAYNSQSPLLPQIEAFANRHSIELKKGWKVELSKSFKQALKNKCKSDIDDSYKDMWVRLFQAFEQ